MSVSKNIVDILNQKGIPTDSLVDLFVNWTKVGLTDCDVKKKITEQKNKLIRYSDHEENDDIIDLLMDLEINQEDHKYNKEALQRRVDKLEGIIETLVDNFDIDLREIVNDQWFTPKSFQRGKAGFGGTMNSSKKETITEEMWLEATKQRRRENNLGKLLDKEKED
ncbi:MAG: hypothetical protein SLAVMIC_00061 [uncultured marine phage]|uniref:Uncharacterized protein n=1 Tax=uncultured marine phage TaxID=707152 RepID=A0A8D9CBF6_9VIRU|nr:MAG: hypothetical protein SLAVMIC_00061 [uncultured marine phage]